MSNKNLAIGTVVILVSTLVVTLATETMLQSINPIAAIAAVTVAAIGIAWFKKTAKS